MNAAKTITAIFNETPAVVSHTLTVQKDGSGTGTVVTPAAINCGPTCSFDYEAGAQVTLTAIPTTGSTFAGWTGGGCSGTGDCVVTMNAAKTVTATFNEGPPPPVLPTLAINNTNVTEGNSGTVTATFTVTLSAQSADTVTVNFTTVAGTTNPATAGVDYVTNSGTLTFNPGNPGETSKTITVTVNGDVAVEQSETFKVLLSNATNATIFDGEGVGTIQNDDSGTPQAVPGAPMWALFGLAAAFVGIITLRRRPQGAR